MSSYRPNYRDSEDRSPKQRAPFDVKRLQCYFWTHETCNWGNQCRYAHRYTGKVADKPIMRPNGLSVAGKNATAERPVYKRWQGRDSSPDGEMLSNDKHQDDPRPTEQGRTQKRALPEEDKSNIQPHKKKCSHPARPPPASKKTHDRSRGYHTQPTSDKQAGQMYGGGDSVRSSTAGPQKSHSQAYTGQKKGSSENVPDQFTSSKSNSPEKGELNDVATVTMSLTVYENLRAAQRFVEKQLEQRNFQISTLLHTMERQQQMIGRGMMLLDEGEVVLKRMGQQAMELSQKMQRGERICPDTVTDAWLAANDLLQQADAHYHTAWRWRQWINAHLSRQAGEPHGSDDSVPNALASQEPSPAIVSPESKE